MKRLIIALFVCSVALVGCTSTKYFSGGARDNGPLIFGDEYELSNLNDLSLDGSAFWGIPTTSKLTKETKNKSGLIFNFNGVDISKSSKIFPIISLIGYTAGIGFGLNQLFGTKQVQQGGSYAGNFFYPNYVSKPNLPLVPALIIAIPIAGTLNNFTYSNSALGAGGSALNYKLLLENPEIDVFFYPKYSVYKKQGFWKQQATINATVKGAKLKMNEFSKDNNYSEINVKKHIELENTATVNSSDNEQNTIKTNSKLTPSDYNGFVKINYGALPRKYKKGEKVIYFDGLFFKGTIYENSNFEKAKVSNIYQKINDKWVPINSSNSNIVKIKIKMVTYYKPN